MRLLQTLIEEEWPDRAIIFANTKYRCEDIWGHLAADGHRVGLLTGDVPQKKRLRIADRMFDLGFIKDIRWLFRRMPPATQRLSMLFSATLSYRVRELAFEHMNNAEYVEVEPEQKTGHRINHADAEPLAKATGLKMGLAYGGDGYDKQLKVLADGVDILVGTTGRLIDYAKQNHVNLGAIQVVVLDEIQALALPFALSGRDVAGQAQTGTGKTMAFLTSTFHYLLSHPAAEGRQVNQPRALIMAPTRELAVQIPGELA
ncbi:hypothetical protein CRX72_01855 [Pantoea sp. BRM17]|nr:hypothetical protein CRX72_01855 [Pantoea sp. BRM17]